MVYEKDCALKRYGHKEAALGKRTLLHHQLDSERHKEVEVILKLSLALLEMNDFGCKLSDIPILVVVMTMPCSGIFRKALVSVHAQFKLKGLCCQP